MEFTMRRSFAAASLFAALTAFVFISPGMNSLAAGASTSTPAIHASVARGDDYPRNLRSSYIDAKIDPWRFYNRECVSFVAWRLSGVNQIPFTNAYGGTWWGNAVNWASAARGIGLTVDHAPALGSVAWKAKPMHVAWVSKVNRDGSINIEEYNYNPPGSYLQRLHISPKQFDGFIHIKDLAGGSKASRAASSVVLAAERAAYRQAHRPANVSLRAHTRNSLRSF
ncbi:MAG: CHAP domain-containing protein [Actinobacteria bacterium]|nr:CHAP domain-containing protein [Actinomycetota bacterium]